MVRKKDLDYVVIVALLATGLYTLVSGLIADWFGFPQFLFHNYAGYACTFLAVVHLTLKRAQVKAYIRSRLRRRRPGGARTPGEQVGKPNGAAQEPESIGVTARQSCQARERPRFLSRRTLLASSLSAAGGFALGWIAPGRRRTDLPIDAADLGQAYHEWSKPGHGQAEGGPSDWGRRPDGHKAYPGSESIALPDPRGWGGPSVESAIEARRSRRTYGAGPLPFEDLSRLLHAASGITDQARGFRASPSAGALYPIEVYAVIHDVTAVPAGIYHYAPARHELELIRAGDLRAEIVVAGIGQAMLGRAQVCLVLSAVFQRTRWRYRERAYRYILLEAGHIAQNVYLAAFALGLGACAVGAFLDGDLNRLVGVDGSDEAALYVLAVGTA